MERPNRPYKGMMAEAQEREELYEITSSTSKKEGDTVVEAAMWCLLIGASTSLFAIGLPFLIGAFAMGLYAAATHRVKNGLTIATIASILFVGSVILIQRLIMNAALNEARKSLEKAFGTPPF